VLALVALLALPGCGWIKRHAYEGFGRRDGWQQPDRVITELGLEPGQVVADVGAGGGYFTFRLAEAVGAQGRVFAVDVDPDMTGFLADKARDEGYTQVETVLAGETDAKIPEPVDLVFTCNTYHHLPDRVNYFARLRQRLKPGGRVAIVEYREGQHATRPEIIRREMGQAGYVLVAEHDYLEKQDFAVFRPSEE
jgi:predicted methyltransferase